MEGSFESKLVTLLLKPERERNKDWGNDER